MQSLRRALLRAWEHRGPLAFSLWPVSIVFGILVELRRFAYTTGLFRTARMPVPVVVVGNVLTGGTGKTPVTMALVRHLQRRGLRPGVVSRGHGRRSRSCKAVHPDSLATDVGDEPLLIARACGVPVHVASSRVDAAHALLAAHPDTNVIICDDGLQHYALQRDIEICLFDDRGTGNGFLWPAGPLREPWPRPVDLVLHTGSRPAFPGFSATRSLAAEAVGANGARKPLASLMKLPLYALAGISQPEVFFAMLRALGLRLKQTLALPDHHDFEGEHLMFAEGQVLVCTEKDAVKLWRQRPDAWAIPLTLQIEPGFLEHLDRLLDVKISLRHGLQTS